MIAVIFQPSRLIFRRTAKVPTSIAVGGEKNIADDTAFIDRDCSGFHFRSSRGPTDHFDCARCGVVVLSEQILLLLPRKAPLAFRRELGRLAGSAPGNDMGALETARVGENRADDRAIPRVTKSERCCSRQPRCSDGHSGCTRR